MASLPNTGTVTHDEWLAMPHLPELHIDISGIWPD